MPTWCWRKHPGAKRRAQGASPRTGISIALLSAKTESALAKMSKNLAQYFKKNPINPGLILADAAYTLQMGRKSFQYRRMMVCSTNHVTDAIDALSSPIPGRHTHFSWKRKIMKWYLCLPAWVTNMWTWPGTVWKRTGFPGGNEPLFWHLKTPTPLWYQRNSLSGYFTAEVAEYAEGRCLQ